MTHNLRDLSQAADCETWIILGKKSPFFVTTQLAGSSSEAQYFYKLGDSLSHIVTHNLKDLSKAADCETGIYIMQAIILFVATQFASSGSEAHFFQ